MTTMRTYNTRTDAIQREIVEPIGAGDAEPADYDIEAIAARVLGDYSQGYACIVDEDQFWRIVGDNYIGTAG
jgi:hypothetical protein